jgi:hypothetical protein
MDNTIEAHGLVKRFGATTALDGVDGVDGLVGHAPILPPAAA